MARDPCVKRAIILALQQSTHKTPMSAAHVIGATTCAETYVYSVIRRLNAAGLVARRRIGRAQVVWLTATGRRLAAVYAQNGAAR